MKFVRVERVRGTTRRIWRGDRYVAAHGAAIFRPACARLPGKDNYGWPPTTDSDCSGGYPPTGLLLLPVQQSIARYHHRSCNTRHDSRNRPGRSIGIRVSRQPEHHRAKGCSGQGA